MEKVTRERHPNRISLTELVYGIYITKKNPTPTIYFEGEGL